MASDHRDRLFSAPAITESERPALAASLPTSTTIPLPRRSRSTSFIPQVDGGADERQWRHQQPPTIDTSQRRQTLHASKVDWRDETANFSNGRVLIVDYVRHDRSPDGKVAIGSQEFHRISGLKQFYRDRGPRGRSHEAALRVIHVQNAKWATDFLMQRFNIEHKDALVGTNFGRWLNYPDPELRAGKPFPKARVWMTQRDPWRGIRRTAFSLDYMKLYRAPDGRVTAAQTQLPPKMMELNQYDDDGSPVYGFDVYAQRLSVYVQYHEQDADTPPDDVRNPYDPANYSFTTGNRSAGVGRIREPSDVPMRLPLDELDTGSTVIVFEKAVSETVKDTLLTARDQIESRWRRLTFFLHRDLITSDERLALHGIDRIVGDVFRGVAYNWEQFLSTSETHMSILEDKVYESPADETRAPELWSNSNMWLKTEKLVYNHMEIVKEARLRLSELSEDDNQPETWLGGIMQEFEKAANMVQENLVKPTANLNDLLYKSVGIRDSRHGLQLNTSMWRLSWITFIFLPLTFMVGFFGMNVRTFAEATTVSLKWYFISAVCLMIVVFTTWYIFKHLLASRRYTPYQRGIYEHLYHNLATTHPSFWTRNGPRHDIEVRGTFDKLKWRLIRYWLHPSRTIYHAPTDPDEDAAGSGLGAWARLKRHLARRWLGRLELRHDTDDEEAELSNLVPGSQRVKIATPTPPAELVASSVPLETGAPGGHQGHLHPSMTMPNMRLHDLDSGQQQSQARPLSAAHSDTSDPARPSSSGGGSSGLIVEERDFDDVEPEDAPWQRRWRRSIDAVAGVGVGAGADIGTLGMANVVG